MAIKKLSKKQAVLIPNEQYGFLASIFKIEVMDDFNVRRDATPNEEMQASVNESGIINPIHTRWKNQDEDTLLIIDGERRFNAAKNSGLKQVPVICHGHMTDKEALLISLTANENQKSLSVSEKAEGFRKLKNLGFTVEEISKAMGAHPRDVREILRLIDKAIPKLKTQALADESIPTRVASRAATLPKKAQEEVLPALKNKTVKEGLEEIRKVETSMGIHPPTATKKEAYKVADDFKKRCQELETVLRFEIGRSPKNKTLLSQMDIIKVLKGEKEVLEVFPTYRTKRTNNDIIAPQAQA